jgi:hypothetical protein
VLVSRCRPETARDERAPDRPRHGQNGDPVSARAAAATPRASPFPRLMSTRATAERAGRNRSRSDLKVTIPISDDAVYLRGVRPGRIAVIDLTIRVLSVCPSRRLASSNCHASPLLRGAAQTGLGWIRRTSAARVRDRSRRRPAPSPTRLAYPFSRSNRLFASGRGGGVADRSVEAPSGIRAVGAQRRSRSGSEGRLRRDRVDDPG